MNFEELVGRAKQRASDRLNSGRPIVFVNEGSCSIYAGVKEVREAFDAACRDHGRSTGHFCMKRNGLLLSKNRMNTLLPLLRGLGAFVLPLFIALSSCSKDDPVTSERSLCQGKSGFAARITGTGSPISICIPNDSINFC